MKIINNIDVMKETMLTSMLTVSTERSMKLYRDTVEWMFFCCNGVVVGCGFVSVYTCYCRTISANRWNSVRRKPLLASRILDGFPCIAGRPLSLPVNLDSDHLIETETYKEKFRLAEFMRSQSNYNEFLKVVFKPQMKTLRVSKVLDRLPISHQ